MPNRRGQPSWADADRERYGAVATPGRTSEEFALSYAGSNGSAIISGSRFAILELEVERSKHVTAG
jgi:hypothetical protein